MKSNLKKLFFASIIRGLPSLALILTVLAFVPPGFAEQHIAWVPSLKQALADARQTGRAILLTSAAPSCGGVPGVW